MRFALLLLGISGAKSTILPAKCFPEIRIGIAVAEVVSATGGCGSLVAALVSTFSSPMPQPMCLAFLLLGIVVAVAAIAESFPRVCVGIAVAQVVSTAWCRGCLIAFVPPFPASMIYPMIFASILLGCCGAEYTLSFT